MVQVSVIVPAYKPVGFDALRTSMTANSDADAEWIIFDDGSGAEYDSVFSELDGTGAKVIRGVENRRQGAARNLGLGQAQGQWIKFLDADDSLDEGHLAALVAAAQAAPKQAIPFAPTQHTFVNGAVSKNDSWRDLPADPNAQFLRQLVGPFLHHCGALFPRSLLEHLGGYDESLITDEDGDLLLRVLRAGYYFTPVESVHYLYIHHENGSRVSSDDNVAKMLARIRTCEKVLEQFGDSVPSNVANAVAQRMDKIAMSYWASHPTEAKSLLKRARSLSSSYRPDMRPSLAVLRSLGGPSLALAAQGAYRRLKGRPEGGAQG
jgi:glycosyltransferase involved in cell wall biosynthesis